MIVLDTDVLTLYELQHGSAYLRLAERLVRTPERVYVTIINFEEQMRGWLSYIAASRTQQREIEGYRRLFCLLDAYRQRDLLEYDDPAARQFDRLRRMHVRIGSMDLKLAAIVLVHDGLLISRNLRDFRKVPGLRVEDWTQ